jgi:hypothetical protein
MTPTDEELQDWKVGSVDTPRMNYARQCGTSATVIEGSKLERELAARTAELKEARRDADRSAGAVRRLTAMLPLFQEARDALPAITLASAQLRGIRLDLADRMDDVGVAERWNAIDARKP